MVKLTRCKVGCLDEVTRVGRDCLAQHRPDSFSSFTRNPPTHASTHTHINNSQLKTVSTKKKLAKQKSDISLFYPLSYLMFRPPSENPALQGQYLLSGVGVPYPAIRPTTNIAKTSFQPLPSVRMASMIFESLSEVGVKVKVSMSISKMGEKVFFPGENISNPGKGIGNSIGKAEE